MAENKQSSLTKLWTSDERVSPWRGTAWGVVQAVNTYEHHIATVKGGPRPERIMARAISGDFDKKDSQALALLGKVLELA